MKKLAVLIPSYKRPEVLRLTLEGLLNNTTQDEGYDVNVGVGINQVSQVDTQIVNEYEALFKGKDISLCSASSDKNVGKAKILNILFTLCATHADYIVTMDNDMVISKPWLQYIDRCDVIDQAMGYDVMGFSAARFWAHDPARDKCPFVSIGDYLFYTPYSVAGGMMLFHRQFLKDNPWTNHGGVYGRDDATICQITHKKYVYYTADDWLVHDPLNSSTPQLKSYEDKKKELYRNGTTVFPVGWDE